MTRENKTWYVEERGELLAREFLLELGARSISAPTMDIGVDYLAFFENDAGAIAIVAVEVKATQREVSRLKYALTVRSVRRLQNMNVPALIIVVQTKSNEVYFAWAHDIDPDKLAMLKESVMVDLRKATHDEIKLLKQQAFHYKPQTG
jgi:hypothetical protein